MSRGKRFAIATLLLVGALGIAQGGVLEDGKKAFKEVVDDVYREMGSPPMSYVVAEELDRLIFLRDIQKEPAFSTKVNTGWGAYKDMIHGSVSTEIDGRPQMLRFLWRPGRELEMIAPDAVLKW